jgi:hypothetical protein
MRGMSVTAADVRKSDGQVLVIFAILIPVFLALASVVIAGGNWYTHGTHLQTKVDASALAGGGAWQFPCGTTIDSSIEAKARAYVGPHTTATGTVQTGGYNAQVGGVDADQVQVRLNAGNWYDNDSNPGQVDKDSPSNSSLCSSMTLDVKATENDSFPLASVIPLFPDLKRRARVEIYEAEATGGFQLLPIAVRAPVPTSAAVFYNEANGNILNVKYFVRQTSILGLPPSLQGWTTYNTEDSSTWANFQPPAGTGVAIAISFRGACYDSSIPGYPNPASNTKIVTSAAPCFQETGFATVNQLCNQGANKIVDCYYATGSHPSAAVQAGLHFIRGYSDANPTVSGPPAVESAFLENVNCLVNGFSTNAYFNSIPGTASNCTGRLNARVDVGPLTGEYGPPGPSGNGPLQNTDVEVTFRMARPGSTQCNWSGVNCNLISSGSGPTFLYRTQGNSQSPHLALTANTLQNAVSIQVRIKNSTNHTNVNCRNPTTFSNNCRWYFTGNGVFGTSVAPTNAQILASPIQRSFRGNSVNSSSVQWLRVTTDTGCDGSADFIDNEAASVQIGGNRCFFMDMGLKGGIAVDADEPSFVFDDGTGASQTGFLDCDPNVPQGQSLRDSIELGCGPWYAKHQFNVTPLCPQQNSIFAQPNPGPPWTNWPPLQCVKTRPTSTPGQVEEGFERRFFNGASTCPPDAAGFVKGRNYWDQDTNPLNNRLYGYQDDSPARNTNFHPADPRIVTIFLVPTGAFGAGGQDTYPIAGFVQVYITGYGRVQNGGNLTVDDPCPGSNPPPQAEIDCSGSSCGYIVWGHFINYVIPGNAVPGPNPAFCDPGDSTQPCVAVLVE